jgi:hypothetical protein
LSAQGWDASYLPLAIERLPFYIGRDGDGLVVHIDLDSPRVSQDTGEAVFLPQGGNTEFLERVNSMLLAIHQGLQGTPALVAALMEHNLLEAFVLEVQQTNGTRLQLSDFYTVHEERLQALSGDALQRLSQAGHLQAAYMALASLSQIRALVERHHRLGDTQA